MKKVVIEVPDTHADIISFTLIGGAGQSQIRVNTSAFDLNKGTYIKVVSNEDGELVFAQI